MRAYWKIAATGVGVALCLGLGLFFVFTHAPAPLTPPASSRGLAASVSQVASSTATSSAPRAATSTAKTTNTTKTTAVDTVPTVSTTTLQARALSASGGALLKSLVNVVCLSADPSIPSISGSGIVIDKRGIIVTAAHVAQLFLLADYLGPSKVQCLVRDGSPARRAYTAEPIYVSSSWLAANPTTLSTKSPVGTGQYDVALLAVTGTATSTPVPSTLAYVPLASATPSADEPVAVASYAAQYLSATDLNYSLYPTLVFGSIYNRYTFGNGTVDEFSVKGTAASEEGSSGGGITNLAGQLIGIITTSSVNGSIADRQLNAVTVYHLRQTYQQDTGHDLETTLQSSSVRTLVDNFRAQAEALGAQLAKNLYQ